MRGNLRWTIPATLSFFDCVRSPIGRVVELFWNHRLPPVLSAGNRHEAFEIFTFVDVLRQTESVQSAMFIPAENHILHQATDKKLGGVKAAFLSWPMVRYEEAPSEEKTHDLAL